MVALGFVLGYGAGMLPVLARVLEELKKQYRFEYLFITPYDSDGSRASRLEKCDVVLIYARALPDPVERLLEKLPSRTRVIGLDELHIHLTNVDPSTHSLANKLLKLGGKDNLRSLALLMLREAGLQSISVPEPVEVPWHGVYHPRLGVFSSTADYLREYEFSDRPLAGILFYRSEWLYGRTLVVDKLVEKLEARGLGVLPVFTYGSKDDVLGAPSSEESIRTFFIGDHGPLIEVLVNLTFFFLLDRTSGKKPCGFKEKPSDTLLRLGVPVLQCIHMTEKSISEWLSDSRGVGYMTIVYRIAMPEVDGAIEPIVIAGSSIGKYGEKVVEVAEEHIEYVARRVEKWVRLRRKKPGERKVAIILINPPCKGLEANVAVGMGLDVPESIARLLHRLKKEGYKIEGDLPKTGEELVKMIMSRKAISEFRWTSVEEIVSRGGALGFVDAETYMKWFMELPEKTREEMVREWGDPRDVLEGRVDKALVGMVYNGKFVVPGLSFGNVIVLPQPKRGCAGSRCDGRVCKILHNPKVPPPHQWLAVYRWVTRVFGADVIIHFGTHGYLEFLPGKGVGLSWMCWPEISIDDVPHLYVYVVSNPMEGSMAKRRGYAVIVDHLYPPMRMASCDNIEELESLLAQHSHARAMGDEARAKVVLEKLLALAREKGIPLPRSESEEEVIEALHKYVHMIRNTQVNRGLHVLGCPPRDPKVLAEYAVTVLSLDSGDTPSIRRVLAELLGLDYDELRRNPGAYNARYGMTNSRLLETLNTIATRSLARMLSLTRDPRDHEILKIVVEEAERCLGQKRL